MNIFKSISQIILKKEIVANKKEISYKEEELNRSKDEISHLKESIKSLRQTSDFQTKTINKKQEEIEQIKKSLNSITKLNNNRLLSISIKNEEILRLQESEDSLKQLIESQKSIIDGKETDILLLQESEESLKRLVESQKSIIEEKETEILRLQESEDSLKRLDESQKSIIEEKETEILRLQESEESLKQQIDSQKLRIEDLSDENDLIKESNLSLTNIIDTLKQTNEELRNENNCLKNERQLVVSEYDKEVRNSELLRNTINNLTKQLSEKDLLIEELEFKLNGYKKDVENCTSQKTKQRSNSANSQTVKKDKEQENKNLKNETEIGKDSNREKLRTCASFTNKDLRDDNKEILTIDFPAIENENKYSDTSRIISQVYNHRSNSIEFAKDIFLNKSVEELSRLRFELEEAIRTGHPYLSCPCCGNLLKISVRTIGFGKNRREVQFFSHAVKNLSCDLKRHYYTTHIENGGSSDFDNSVLRELRDNIYQSLKTEKSHEMGISDVEKNIYINSTELPSMSRRLVDITAKLKNRELVFEIVTPVTHISRVRDRDIFYLINNKQVLWIFGLNSVVNYDELSRSVAKDILFTNKRNIFVFDTEAQIESKKQGKLILKCNWLEENGEWYFRINKNGINGILITLDQLKFDSDSCRPYFYDADEDYFEHNPSADQPLKQSREELIMEMSNKNMAVEQMEKEGRSVQAYSNGDKWGFKFEDITFIDPIFDFAPQICGNYAIVERHHKFGVIDNFGDFILPVEFNRIAVLPNGQIIYADSKNWVLNGEDIIIGDYWILGDISVKTIDAYKSIFHVVANSNIKGHEIQIYFIGRQLIIQDPYGKQWYAFDLDDDSEEGIEWDDFELTATNDLKITVDGQTRIVDSEGELIKYIPSESIKNDTKKTNVTDSYLIIKNTSGKYGIRNQSNTIITPKYDFLESWGNKKFIAAVNKRYGIIDVNGNHLLDFQYVYISMYLHGESRIDTVNSKIIVYENLEQVMSMAFDLKKVKREDKWGVMDKYGNIVIDFIYDEITSYNNTLIGIQGNKFEDLNIYYPAKLGFLAVNEGIVGGKNTISVGDLKLERVTQAPKKNLGMVESFYINNWDKDSLPLVKPVEKSIEIPINICHTLRVGIKVRVKVIGILNNISGENKSRIIVMDSIQSIWAINSDEIANYKVFEKKILISRFLSLTKIEHHKPNISTWEIEKVFRQRFINKDLFNEED